MTDMSETTGPPHLYPQEILENVAGFPTIHYYSPPASNAEEGRTGESSKPLIVCVPGGLHLARVFYGRHDGSRQEDFLAYWLNKLGFGVLALSYPLETEPEIMPLTGTHFRIRDWGRQAAMTTKKVMEEKDITGNRVILISWSMGGRMVVQFNIAAKELGLDVQLYISFAGTPGFSSIRPLPTSMTCSKAGYFHITPHTPAFYKQVKEMADLNGGREIVPYDVYQREYIGGTPVNLIGLRQKFDGEQAFIQDELTHEEDTLVLDVASLPLISAIYPTSILDASHALADKASWGFLLTYKLETMIGSQGLLNVKGTPKWPRLMDLVHSAPDKLCIPATGNHFFFVGEESARNAADQVVRLLNEALMLQTELYDLLGLSGV